MHSQSAPPEEATLPFTLTTAKNGSLTALDGSRALHSLYNPEREAEQAVSALHTSDTLAFAFFGCALGYAPVRAATLFPHDTLIIIEPSADWFFAALTACDWSAVFNAKNVMLALQAGVDTVTTLIEQAGGGSSKHVACLINSAYTAHAADYFSALSSSLNRASKKERINTVTLEKFSRLWLRNSCKNLMQTALLPGVNRYKNACIMPDGKRLPALVLAAGPTLETVLPHLAALKKRMLIIAVDTALRACLHAGVQPDFILLVDPQYYAWRHIAGLSAPESVLICESAVYPASLRFPCREIIACSSLFPLGKYLEKRLGAKGALAAGGSVSTTAWDFARLCGARRIYLAGLDLGYPGLETHIRGSTFEERLHGTSCRTRPAETGSAATLFGANMRHSRTYAGGDILTDDRMQLFAWWFESKQQEYAPSRPDGVETYSLSPHSLAIPGIGVTDVPTLLSEPEREELRASFFASAKAQESSTSAEQVAQVIRELKNGFECLHQTARTGAKLCDEALDGSMRLKKGVAYYCQALEAVDAAILTSELKEIAALVFPTERQLDALYEKEDFSQNPVLSSFEHSKIIYRELKNSIKSYLQYL